MEERTVAVIRAEREANGYKKPKNPPKPREPRLPTEPRVIHDVLVDKRPAVKCICKECDREFYARRDRVRRGEGGEYCSRRCAAKSVVYRFTPESTKQQRIRANGLINSRIKRGKLIRPTKCEECGRRGRIEGHHDDYTKPEEVKWLCHSCHMKKHIKSRKR